MRSMLCIENVLRKIMVKGKKISPSYLFFLGGGGGGGENPVQFSLDIFERISIYVLILRL